VRTGRTRTTPLNRPPPRRQAYRFTLLALFGVQMVVCASRLAYLKLAKSSSMSVQVAACLSYASLAYFVDFAVDPLRFYMDGTAVADAVRPPPRAPRPPPR
jgi:hypothetical protein